MNKRKDIIPNNLKDYRLKAGLTHKSKSQRLLTLKHRKELVTGKRDVIFPTY